MFDINAKKQRNKQKKNYEIVLSSMHGVPRPQNHIKTQIEIHTSMESQYLDLWLYVDINIDEKIMSTTKL